MNINIRNSLDLDLKGLITTEYNYRKKKWFIFKALFQKLYFNYALGTAKQKIQKASANNESQLTFICSKPTIEIKKKKEWNILRVNNKNTRTMPVTFKKFFYLYSNLK